MDNREPCFLVKHSSKELRVTSELYDLEDEFDEWFDEWMEKQIDYSMDQWIDQWMNEWFLQNVPEKLGLLSSKECMDLINIKRLVLGEYVCVCVRIRNHPEKFFKYFRMSESTYDYILDFISANLKSSDGKLSHISPSEQLAVTLRYLSTGMSFEALSKSFYIDSPTVRQIVRQVCETIYEKFGDAHMPRPTCKDFLRVADAYEELWQFPNCVGAIGNKHIRIQHALESNSLLMEAIADGNFKFLCVGYDRKTVFRVLPTSSLNELISNPKNFPPNHLIKGTNFALPYVFVCNNAYPLKENMMRSYSGTKLTYEQNIFNRRLSRARRCVEFAFGICVSKWRVLLKPIKASEETCRKIINCVALLHNIVIDKEGIDSRFVKAVFEKVNPKGCFHAPMKTGRRYKRSSSSSLTIRDTFKDYFNSST